jgi:hypothetical protein
LPPPNHRVRDEPALSGAIGTDPDVKLFDDFDLFNEVIADPGAFGLSNATDACAQFLTCDPSEFLFWDGIHPTSATEAIISDAIDSLVLPKTLNWRCSLRPFGARLYALAGRAFGRCAIDPSLRPYEQASDRSILENSSAFRP